MKVLFQLVFVNLVFLLFKSVSCKESLLAVTVATKETDGYKRYLRSIKHYGFDHEVYGIGEEWKGGDVARYAGGGHKVNILIKALEKYKDDREKVILFTDSYDVILVQKPEEVLEKFKSFDSRIVFSAEGFCWPDKSLESDYPAVDAGEKRFLNSGAFIGYAADLYDIITSSPIKDDDDDQLFYTKIFLNKPSRDRYHMKLDTKSVIFQNLNGAIEEITVIVSETEIYLYNNVTKATPSVIHGNGPSKIVLNRLGNYIANAFTKNDGCITCNEDMITLDLGKRSEWPDVTLAIFIETPTPFLREFFEKISELNYPKEKITVLIHNNVKYHNTLVEKFFTNPTSNYKSIKYISPNDDSTEYDARTEAVQECVNSKCKYFFSIDSTAHIDNVDTLKLLIEQNRAVLSPIMIRKDTTWSNVWGAIGEKGYYSRSEDYLDIINRNLLGVWNLPYVSEAILIKGDVLKENKILFEDPQLDPTMAFASNLRNLGIYMYGTNMEYFGHLVNPDSFNTSLVRPEMFEIFNNFDDWLSRYVRSEYYDFVNGKTEPLQPCPDVYWFPVVTDEFCEDLIFMMESFGKWSGGKDNNFDTRLPGGYENVPTVDIHMTQVGYQNHWLYFLRKVIQPMQRRVFLGYYHDPPEASLNFVVRYRPDEQDHLKPHHDASTYTLNLALNTPVVDYQGGGCRFVRYNCSITDTKKGWVTIHPGRLTHYHEGLKVTGGTRYIMISFIDP